MTRTVTSEIFIRSKFQYFENITKMGEGQNFEQ